VVIGGWIPAGRSLKTLLLGVRDGRTGLRYVGKVGTGFTDTQRQHLAALLNPLAVDASPFTTGPDVPTSEPVQFVSPELAGEVDYLEATVTGVLRHPVWRGLRSDHGD
jgi:bifunctional non-homologous end joining protein LigD